MAELKTITTINTQADKKVIGPSSGSHQETRI